jgi:hypothetical protein
MSQQSIGFKTQEQLEEQETEWYRLKVYTAALSIVGPFYEDLQAGRKMEKFSFEGGDEKFNKDVTTVANELTVIWGTRLEETPTKPVEVSTGMPDGPSSPDRNPAAGTCTQIVVYKMGEHV